MSHARWLGANPVDRTPEYARRRASGAAGRNACRPSGAGPRRTTRVLGWVGQEPEAARCSAKRRTTPGHGGHRGGLEVAGQRIVGVPTDAPELSEVPEPVEVELAGAIAPG